MIATDDRHAGEAVASSVIGTTARNLQARIAVAWHQSRTSTIWKTAATALLRRDPAERVRLCGFTLATASVASLLIRAALPAYSAPGLPWWWYAALGGLFFTIGMFAGPISAAWPQSAAGRLLRDPRS
jgi:hypothetical protein